VEDQIADVIKAVGPLEGMVGWKVVEDMPSHDLAGLGSKGEYRTRLHSR